MIIPKYHGDMTRYDNCTVTANGQSVPVLGVDVNHSRVWSERPKTAKTPMATLQIGGAVNFQVTYEDVDLTHAIVRPLSAGIVPAIDGKTISFTVTEPGYYTVEYNEGVEGALMLFADAIETDIPTAGDSVIILEAGIHDRNIILQDGQTLYFKPGAVLRGNVATHGANDVRICGYGVIDGSPFDRWDSTLVPIEINNSKNVVVEGVTVINPAAWMFNTYHCEDVEIRNVKLISACSNGDGITTQSCRRLTARDCFVRGWDDNLVVKAYDGDVSDILFERCILWTDLAQSCEVGYETRGELMENITFRDITVLHNFHKPIASIHNSDSALIRNVRFENITVEECMLGLGDGQNIFLELTTTTSQWTKTEKRGNIRDVVFENIDIQYGRYPQVRIFAVDAESTIDDVLFKNITIHGNKITGDGDIRILTNDFVGDNIRWE